MKFWTVQSNEVFDIIEKEGIYYPDFNKSRYNDESMKLVYSFLLNSFNIVNNLSCTGLVFSFVKFGFNVPTIFDDFSDFSSFIKSKSDIVRYMWCSFSKDSKILEIEIEDNFNPLYIDFNDFQILMPKNLETIKKIEFYKLLGIKVDIGEEYEPILRDNLEKGIFYKTVKHSCGLIQAHLPCIKRENILSVNPLFTV